MVFLLPSSSSCCCCFRCRKGAVAVQKECLLAPILLICLLIFSSLHYVTTILAHGILLPVIHFSLQRYHPKLRYTNFYLCWTIASFVILVIVFEFEVVPFLEILMLENGILIILAACSVILAAVVRSRSLNQSLLQPNPRRMSTDSFKHNYCTYIQSVITSRNRWYLVACLLCTICSLVYSSHLIMSTICHPVLVADSILLPDDCSDVYSDPV